MTLAGCEEKGSMKSAGKVYELTWQSIPEERVTVRSSLNFYRLTR
jgi:hypothetical protein